MTAVRCEVGDACRPRPIRIGISACLLGPQGRFDGGHKRDAFLTETFGRFVEWVPVCPDRMERFSRPRLSALAGEHLSGYVLKKDSPSCGLVEAYPYLPVEEEGRLADPRLRDNFVERVFAYWRLRGLFDGRWTVADLVRFHTAHKLLLLAHAPEAYRRLGRLVAEARAVSRRDLERRYVDGLMQALGRLATPRRHTNVLQHMAGYFKDRLDAASKRELADAIGDYRRGLVPLVVPLSLVRHHVRVIDVPYLAGQLYLDPYPKELMLRSQHPPSRVARAGSRQPASAIRASGGTTRDR
jgi:uncharacterized protein YbgA (DUF1722 family)